MSNFNPETSFLQERIRQAKLAFNLLLGATVTFYLQRYFGIRKNLFDLRRLAVIHNLHVLQRISEKTSSLAASVL